MPGLVNTSISPHLFTKKKVRVRPSNHYFPSIIIYLSIKNHKLEENLFENIECTQVEVFLSILEGESGVNQCSLTLDAS